MPSLGGRLGREAVLGRSRHLLRAPEQHAYEEKRNGSHHCVAKDSDIPDIVPKPDVHVRKWHTDQPCETQVTTDNQENPHRRLQPATLEYRCRKEHREGK